MTKYTDGRPAGGAPYDKWTVVEILYNTQQQQQSKSAALLRVSFLCENLLFRPIRFQATALFWKQMKSIMSFKPMLLVWVVTNTLDPLASAFLGSGGLIFMIEEN